MSASASKSAVDAAAVGLRAIALGAEPETLIGSEDALIEALGCSRSTVRQAARILELEGLLRVRRGINGGYFGTRPSEKTIENTVSAYLEMLDIETQDVTVVASALWVEVMRKAASRKTGQAREVAERFKKRVARLKPTAGFSEVRLLELESRRSIFELANCGYIQLIFNINTTFATRRFTNRPNIDDSEEHREFVRAWRDAKLMELTSIAEGDVELSAMAARHIRNVWHRRVWHPALAAPHDAFPATTHP